MLLDGVISLSYYQNVWKPVRAEERVMKVFSFHFSFFAKSRGELSSNWLYRGTTNE